MPFFVIFYREEFVDKNRSMYKFYIAERGVEMSSVLIKKRNISNQNLIVIVLGLLLFVPPYLRGLFPIKSWLAYELIISLFFVAVLLVQRNELNIRQDGMSWSVLGLIGSYLLAFFAAYNKGGAYLEVLKLAGYFYVFYLCKIAIKKLDDVKKILLFLYWSGVGAAFLSLGTAFGTFGYPGAFLNNRLFSTLQYPNTFAGYMASLIIPGVFFLISNKQIKLKLIYATGNAILFLGFFSTISRGGYLTILVITIIFIAGLARKYKITALTYMIYSITVFFFISNKLMSELPLHSPIYYWLWFITAVILGLVPVIIWFYTPDLLTFKPSKKFGFIVFLMVFFALGLVFFINDKNITTGGGKINFIQGIIVSRLTGLETFQDRIVYYKDAVKIIKDHPVIGTGGQGWNSVYRQYQPYNYSSSLIHSQYLQILVEAGIVGFLALLTTWFLFFSAVIKLIRKNSGDNRFLIWVVACAALAIGFHSIIDFTLSIPSVAFVLWSLWGMIAGIHQKNLEEANTKSKILFSVIIGAGLVSILFAFALFSANYTDKGIKAYNNQQYKKAEESFKNAINFNPLNSENYAHLSRIYIIMGVDNNNRNELEKSLTFVNKAVKLDRNNPEIRTLKGKAHFDLDQIQEGVEEFEKANRLAPYVQKFNDELEEIYFLVGQYYLLKGEKANAKIYMQKAVLFPETVEKRIKFIETNFNNLQLNNEHKLVITDSIKTKQLEAKKILAIIR